ncbi:zinc-ribbon and DUF3426 domain-containing protein [Burkholderia oklahomensis]|uniref:Family finger-like domain protein n=1 Tax=Burkholderia oklahomensis TaxID=342113 RepID=A0AAI8B5N4_9BURK|nr:zinc-ribbon and DUF3426 domain-containing protein [Burkholderia oklahomensis]AIO66161.1 family finger-like domain protein [Burkholderia oklahomensis]AOI41230.1 thioredoxin [Burkholderia oklahomensis EO147]KUY63720.1 thioredoxin [Burkholderia oklahomensis EO147]
MLLATRCPHCETVFRLQQEQLALHDGLVRCGHCQLVFDAARTLVPAEPDAAAAQAAPHAPQQQPAPQRLFDATSPDLRPLEAGHRDFAPGAWDMWAPWLDGTVDPKLQMTGASVGAAANGAAATRVPADESREIASDASTHEVPAPPETPRAHLAETPALAEQAARTPPASDTAAHAAQTSDADMPAVGIRHFPPPPSPTLDIARTDARREPEAARPPAPGSRTHDAAEPVLASPAAATAALADAAHDHEPRFGAAASPRTDAEPFATSPEPDNREHFAMTRETRTSAAGGGFARALGVLVALALAALLAAQLAWWQRETITIYWPSTEPLFKQACAKLGCMVTPPRAIDGLRLDASDLRQLDGPRLLELKVPLTNRYRVALAYPSIELTLLDEANNITARRVLAPRDYVRPGARVEAGMPAGATQTMIVRIETDGIAASNFRVQIFYP